MTRTSISCRHVRRVSCRAMERHGRCSDVLAAGYMGGRCGRCGSPTVWTMGGSGFVGKVHHCMVDGLAAVELAALLLDPTPERCADRTRHLAGRGRRPTASASCSAEWWTGSARASRAGAAPHGALAQHPRRLLGLAGKGLQTARAVSRSLEVATPDSGFNGPSSAGRHLASAQRPLADLKRIKSRFETTINDVVLAVAAGGLRSFLSSRTSCRSSSKPWCR